MSERIVYESVRREKEILYTYVMTCHATETWNNVKCRLELRYQDGSMVGTMLSKNAVSIHKNEQLEICLELDAMHLTPGRYR